MGTEKIKADLDLRKLEIFYWVAELKSFSQAAELLSLRQPTVSAHIQELEQLVQGELLYRIRGRVSLTPLGQLLYERAKNLLAFKREAIAAIEQFHGAPSGELWVGGSNNPGEYLLPPRLGAFVKKYPGIKPILRIGDSASIVEDLLDGKVELGFVGVKNRDERLVFEKIGDDKMVLVVARNHPWTRRKFVQLSELRGQPFISRERGSGTMDSLRRLLRKSGQSPERLLHVVMELGSTEAIKEAIMGGYGVSILSRVSIRHELAHGSLVEVPIRGFKMERDFYLVYHRGRPLHPNAQAFRDFLKNG
ncbi:MAG TPA: selenium metabolism-associated LysR family transcriptional regulator [Candidatus Acidoferrales bacterium]|nr:selenium metabolism-associated LysR family transcriptional regulator [Candidatus Acidoferrales bacterium]